MGSVWSVSFCNRTKNLGLGKVSTAGEQDVPRTGIFQCFEHVKDGKEHGRSTGECPKNEQPRLVTETGRHKGDGQRESKDEQEGLQSGRVKHQVELRVSVKRQNHQQNGGQHHEEHHAQRG